jgi:hypothetical protein
MTVMEQDAWAYSAERGEPRPAVPGLEEALRIAGYGARVSLRGLLVGWLLLGPPPDPHRADPAARRGCPWL